MMSSEIEYQEGKILANAVKKHISSFQIKEHCPLVPEIGVDIIKVQDLDDLDLDSCIRLLDVNLGKTYASVNGPKWKVAKKEEMQELGLVYVLIKHNKKLLGFLSMKLINEYDLCVLYLYEIQLDEKYRNLKLGTFLMSRLECIVKSINQEGKLKKIWFKAYNEEYIDINDPTLLLSGTALTVFSSNKGAKKLYEKLGYKLHPDSPTDKILRSGKIIEPNYYMLEKKI